MNSVDKQQQQAMERLFTKRSYMYIYICMCACWHMYMCARECRCLKEMCFLALKDVSSHLKKMKDRRRVKNF